MKDSKTAKQTKRRPYATMACTHCRKSHCKCDGQSPSCSRCTRRGLICSYQPQRWNYVAHVKELEDEASQLREQVAWWEQHFKKWVPPPPPGQQLSPSSPSSSTLHHAHSLSNSPMLQQLPSDLNIQQSVSLRDDGQDSPSSSDRFSERFDDLLLKTEMVAPPSHFSAPVPPHSGAKYGYTAGEDGFSSRYQPPEAPAELSAASKLPSIRELVHSLSPLSPSTDEPHSLSRSPEIESALYYDRDEQVPVNPTMQKHPTSSDYYPVREAGINRRIPADVGPNYGTSDLRTYPSPAQYSNNNNFVQNTPFRRITSVESMASVDSRVAKEAVINHKHKSEFISQGTHQLPSIQVIHGNPPVSPPTYAPTNTRGAGGGPSTFPSSASFSPSNPTQRRAPSSPPYKTRRTTRALKEMSNSETTTTSTTMIIPPASQHQHQNRHHHHQHNHQNQHQHHQHHQNLHQNHHHHQNHQHHHHSQASAVVSTQHQRIATSSSSSSSGSSSVDMSYSSLPPPLHKSNGIINPNFSSSSSPSNRLHDGKRSLESFVDSSDETAPEAKKQRIR